MLATLPAPGDWQPLSPVLLWCAVAGVVYTYGRIRLRRSHPSSPLLSRLGLVSFWSAVGLVVAVLVSPIDVWSEELFAFHMIQHLVLALIAPLLFVLARPLQVSSHGLDSSTRRVVLQAVRTPLVATHSLHATLRLGLIAVAAHVLLFAVWHVPVLYDAAVQHSPVHILEHATMFLAGLGLWWAVIGIGWHGKSAMAILLLFIAGLPMGALAALLTFAPSPLYSAHLLTTAGWGLSPLEDQQLAGGIMWVPGGTLYLALAVVLFIRWLGAGPAPGVAPVVQRS